MAKSAREYFNLKIKGRFFENTLILPVIKKNIKNCTVTTNGGRVTLPLGIFEKRTYELNEIAQLYSALNFVARLTWDARVAVTKTSRMPTLKSQRCIVTVATAGPPSSEKEIQITMPISRIINEKGLSYIPVSLMDKLLSKHERLVHVSSPIISSLIAEIGAIAKELKHLDMQEHIKQFGSKKEMLDPKQTREGPSPGTTLLDLTIDGVFCHETLPLLLTTQTKTACRISTEVGSVWLPFRTFNKRTYNYSQVKVLVKALEKLSVESKDAMVVVKKTDIMPTEKTLKCHVGITNNDFWLNSVRYITVTLPEYQIVERDGLWHVPIALIDRKLTKHERLAHVSTPAISCLISQIEQAVLRVKEADKVEALINCPPDEFTKKDG